ncbi:MAG: polysaccharide deacetylase family protein [Bacteroidales bacterium]|nr:polysaccharide deacetylase family protein [Bacteroidales bacterium]
MRTICLYFQVHQPFRFRRYRFFDIGNEHYYYDDYLNESIMRKVADNCYLPANNIIYQIIKEYGCRFKVAFSITGLALDQFELYAPEVLDSFKKLAKTGCVEFLAETYSHSLVSLKDPVEFEKQVKEQTQRIKNYFGQEPGVFRNTELIYSDKIGSMISDMGFKAMLTEGAKHILGWKSPNYVYYNAINPRLKILLKNFKLSDDIAFRFSNRGWSEYPLTAEKYVKWLTNLDKKEEVINLFMDYETFGEHQWMDTGIFEFLKALPGWVFKKSDFTFGTPGEVADSFQPVAAVNVIHPISWADEERDLTAWLGNELQEDAFNKLYALTERVNRCSDPKILKDWKYLQASDHFYYMSTKFFSDGEVHAYFNPYESPYDAYINYMNILSDFIIRLNAAVPETDKDLHMANLNDAIEEKNRIIEKYEAEIKRLQKTAPMEKKDAAKGKTEKIIVKDRKSAPKLKDKQTVAKTSKKNTAEKVVKKKSTGAKKPGSGATKKRKQAPGKK